MSNPEYEYNRTAELAEAGFAVTVTHIPLEVQVRILEDKIKELEAIIARLKPRV